MCFLSHRERWIKNFSSKQSTNGSDGRTNVASDWIVSKEYWTHGQLNPFTDSVPVLTSSFTPPRNPNQAAGEGTDVVSALPPPPLHLSHGGQIQSRPSK